jgi:hypothetical protein
VFQNSLVLNGKFFGGKYARNERFSQVTVMQGIRNARPKREEKGGLGGAALDANEGST